MQKIVFAFLMAVVSLFISGLMDASIASAEEVWVYTDSDGKEYYVLTETVRKEGNGYSWGQSYSFSFAVDVRILDPKYNYKPYAPEMYFFAYYENTGVWTGCAGGRERLLNDERHPEYYPIWEVAREYL